MSDLSKEQKFSRFALFTTLFTFFLIFVGGLVRVSGAGLGCPDWPKCFGRWIPPTSVDKLPAHIDPSLFNFTLAWIEYINRLVGVFVGLFILILAVRALLRMREYPKVVYPSIAALILVIIQGWQGSQVVSSALEPFIVSIHTLLAFIIVSVLIYVTLQAMIIHNPDILAPGLRRFKLEIIILYLITIIQVVLGTQLRSELQLLEESVPLLAMIREASVVGPMNEIHMVIGLIVMALTLFTGYRVVMDVNVKNPYLKTNIVAFMILVLVQMIVGIILNYFQLWELMQVIHLWLSSLMIGALLVIYSIAK